MFVGIDVSKDRLDVHIRPTGEAFVVTRDDAGLQDLVDRLCRMRPTLIVLEATGGFETVAACALAAAGLPLAVVNPRRIRDFAKACGRLAKTDPLDAAVIARFAEAVQPPACAIADAALRQLSELVTRRRQIIVMMVAERNRRQQLTQAKLIRTVDRVLAELQRQRSLVEAEIDQTIRATPAWRDTERLLTSAPGVGPTIARVCIAELPELGRLTRRQISALVGVAPFNHDSGRRRGKRAIADGRTSVRAALYMAVMVALRRQLPLAAFYARLRAAGKPAKVAMVASMRKLLTRLNAMMRDGVAWRSA